MGLYFIIFVFLVISIILGRKFQNVQTLLFFSWILFFGFMSAVRDGIGADFNSYIIIFDSAPSWNSFFSSDVFIDRGYWLLNLIIRDLGGDHQVLFFCTSIMTTSVFYVVAKRILPKYTLLSLLLFYCFFLLKYEFNTIRHGIMVMWVWLSFTYILSKQLKYFLICVAIGGTFHIIGFLFIPFYWFLNREIKPSYNFILLICSYIMGEFFSIFEFFKLIVPVNSVIGRKLVYYTEVYYSNTNASEHGVTLGFIVYSLVLCILIFYKQRFENYKYYNLLRNSLLLSLCFTLLFSQYTVFVERFVSLLYLSLMFIIPATVNYLSKVRTTRMILYIIILLYCVLLLYKNLHSTNMYGEYQYIPYKYSM